MKTTISLPDDLFFAAEALAAKLGVSRSEIYALAVAEFVAKHQPPSSGSDRARDLHSSGIR